MKTLMKIAVVLTLLLLAGCCAVEGIGRDVQWLGSMRATQTADK